VKGRTIFAVLVLLTGSFLLSSCGGGGQYADKEPMPPVIEPDVEETEITEPAVEPEVEPLPEMVVLNTVYFDYDRSDVRSDQRGALADNASTAEAHPEINVTIEGYCDERGTNEYNMALGQRRADSVKRYLVNYGIDPSKLNTVSYGEERPADPGSDETAWRRNRRAEFAILR